MRTELLAPAKNKEVAFSAIDCGADAVYIGASSFGARKNAANSLEDIKEVVNYAHKFWVKVFITLNTILTDEELKDSVELVKKLTEIGVDGIIIQDLGLLEELIELQKNVKLPPIHMSTQCDNYNPQKIRFFNEVGVSRVVLARETSMEQIRQIHNSNPDLELEAFIHGALCVSMSGQCYLSQYIGGRSANRGECAQPCRKKYQVETEDGEIIKKDFYPLCLKDFNASALVNEMAEAGVYSFKIEGRLKDKNYVKNVVSYYRNLLGKGISSGKTNAKIYPLDKSFNRGFTEYFLKGRSNCFSPISPKSKGEYVGEVIEVVKDCFKVITDKEIHPQDGIYCNDDGFLVNKVTTSPQTSAQGECVIIYPNRKVLVNKGDKIYRNLDIEFEKEMLQPVKRQIAVKVLVTPTPTSDAFSIQGRNIVITLVDEDGVSFDLTLSEGEKANNPEKMKETFINQFFKTGESDFYIEDIKIETELPFMPISEVNKLRRKLFEKLMLKRLERYEDSRESQKVMTHCQYFENEVDYKANVYNNSAEKFYHKCGVKVLEPAMEKAKPKRQIPLMKCKHCIKYMLNMCKSPKKLVLRDDFGNIYPLKFNCKNCEMEVYSPN